MFFIGYLAAILFLARAGFATLSKLPTVLDQQRPGHRALFMHFVRNIVANDRPRHAVTYDWRYDDPKRSIDFVTCGSGSNGLAQRFGWERLGDIPSFPYIAAIETITWRSAQCGTCWAITYNSRTIAVVGVDSMGRGVNLPFRTFKMLVGWDADLGAVDGTIAQLPLTAEECLQYNYKSTHTKE